MKRMFAVAVLLAAVAAPGLVAQEEKDPLDQIREEWSKFQNLTDEEKARYVGDRIEEVVRTGAEQLPEPQRTQVLEQLADWRKLQAMTPAQRMAELQRRQREDMEKALAQLPAEQADQVREMMRQVEELQKLTPAERRDRMEEMRRQQLRMFLSQLPPEVRHAIRDAQKEIEKLRDMTMEERVEYLRKRLERLFEEGASAIQPPAMAEKKAETAPAEPKKDGEK